jgi:anti-repressor protein
MKNLKIFDNQKGLTVYTRTEGKKVAWGRDLKEELGVSESTKYTDWIMDNLSAVGATENKDYEVLRFETKNSNGGRPSINHLLTIDIAKHICMVVGAMPRANETLNVDLLFNYS